MGVVQSIKKFLLYEGGGTKTINKIVLFYKSGTMGHRKWVPTLLRKVRVGILKAFWRKR